MNNNSDTPGDLLQGTVEPSRRENLVQWLVMWAKLRAGGANREETAGLMTPALQTFWPRGRQEPWHYLCEVCWDTGWQPALREDALGHPIPAVRLCDCPKGAAFFAAVERAEARRQAARHKRPGGWSTLGPHSRGREA